MSTATSVVASELLPLVYEYLAQSGFAAAAETLRKETKKDLATLAANRQDSTKLLDMVSLYQKHKPAAAIKSFSQKKKVESSDSDDDKVAKPAVATKAAKESGDPVPVTKPATKVVAELDSDSDDSDAKPAQKQGAKKPAPVAVTQKTPTKSTKAALDSDSDDSDAKPTVKPVAKPAAPAAKPAAKADSDDDSDDNKKTPPAAKPAAAVKPAAAKPTITADSDSDSDAPKPKVTPKVTIEKEPARAKEQAQAAPVEEDSIPDVMKNAKKRKAAEDETPTNGRNVNRPFQRIDHSLVNELAPEMRDNSFLGQLEIGGGTEWGLKANTTLAAVKGKGFRHEKTKKKRGSYRGGTLTTEVRSKKFE